MADEPCCEESVISSEGDFGVTKMTTVELEALLTLNKAKKKRQKNRVEVLKDLLAEEIMKINKIERELGRVEAELDRRNRRKNFRSSDTSRDSYSAADAYEEEEVCLRKKPSNYYEIGQNQASLLGDYEMWPCSRSNQILIPPSPPSQDYGGLLSLSVSADYHQDSKNFNKISQNNISDLSEREASKEIEASLLAESRCSNEEKVKNYNRDFHEHNDLDFRSPPQPDWGRFVLKFSQELALLNENVNISDLREENEQNNSNNYEAKKEESMDLIDTHTLGINRVFGNPLEVPSKISVNEQVFNREYSLRKELFEPLLPSEISSNIESYPLSELSPNRSYDLCATPEEQENYCEISQRRSETFGHETEKLQEEKCHDLSCEFISSPSISPKPDLNFLGEELWDCESSDEERSKPDSL